MSRPYHVAIIGGGIAGLSAGYHLQKAAQERALPLSYTLVEQEDRLGGKILTENVDGFIIEGGPDSFITQKPAALQLARELDLGEELVGTNPDQRAVYVLHRGRLVPLPDGVLLVVPTRWLPFVFTPLFSLPGKLRMAMDWFIPPRREDGDESLAGFIERRLGREALERLAEPLMAGIYVADAGRLSLDATFPRFRLMEQKYGSLIRGMRAARRNRPPAPKGITVFMTLRAGLRQLVDAIAQRLQGRILTGQRVTGWERTVSGYRLMVAGGPPLEADAVVLALPSFVAADWVRPHAPEASVMLQAVPYVSTATVSLGYRSQDCPHPLNGYGFVVPRSEPTRLLACTWTSTKFPHRAPPGHVLLRAFLGGSHDEQVVQNASEAELIDLVRAEFRSLLGIEAEPVVARAYRWLNGNPQYEVGHLQHVQRINELLAQYLPGIHLTGSPYQGVGIPDCITQGKETAERIVDELTGVEREGTAVVSG